MGIMRVTRACFSAALIVAVTSTIAWAQATAQLNGTVRDESGAVLVLASDWRVSGIANARSGSWLTVTTARDLAGTGIAGQRVNQTSDNPYGAKTLTNYLNVASFAFPALGTYGDHTQNSIEGPGFWTVDLAVSRLVSVSDRQTMEFRVEIFNLFNNFNWGNPVTNLDAGTFGQILTQSGEPRIMQFGFKFGF